MPPTEERALIQRAQRGDAAAFEELVRLYDRTVLRLALNVVRSEDDARDVYQESFLKAYRSLASFRHDSRFETWLFRIVTNVCLDHLRRTAARAVEPTPSADGRDGAQDAMEAIADHHPDRDPERLMARRQIARRIERALEHLSPRERLVFSLRHDQDLPLRSIAAILDTTEETARNCLYRAHREMRAMLGDLRRAPGRAARASEERTP